MIWFVLIRFKAEVANALESFVENEDEYIKQVTQKLFFTNTNFSSNFLTHYSQLLSEAILNSAVLGALGKINAV